MMNYILCFLSGMLITALISLLTAHHRQKRRNSELLRLCDRIDEILHEKGTVRFEEFQEGELSILASEIYKMTVRLREQNLQLRKDRQFMKESLEDLSHQLRTPLTSMLILVSTLRKSELSDHDRTQKIQELLKLLTQMQWQIETLLKLSRLEAGAVQFRISTFPVSELIRSALDPIAISLELKNINIIINIQNQPELSGDQPYLTEAVLNILKNCMEHTPESGTIRIQASENAVCTTILISDSGTGISEEAIPHIFDRFYRGTERSGNGFGIGLAFARKIITSQNGSLQVRNIQPHGAEFEIRIYKITSI